MNYTSLYSINDFGSTDTDNLPTDWCMSSFERAAYLRRETVNPRGGEKYVGLEHIDSGLPYLVRFGDSSEVRSAKNKFYTGDVLYGKLRPYLDKCVLAPFDGVCSTDIIVLNANETTATNTFLVHLLHTTQFVTHAIQTTSGVNHPRTSWNALKEFTFPLPPLSEQKKIATVLSAVQEAKEKTENVMRGAKELKKSLMKHMFTYGAVPVEKAAGVPLKETELGFMPESWSIMSLDDTGKIFTGTTPRTQNLNYYGGEYMFISPADMSDSKYIRKTEKTITAEGLRVSRCLPKDTVLVVCIGATIGKTGMTLSSNSATNQQINAIVTNDSYNPQYLYYTLSHFSHLLPSLASRAAIPIVNKSNFAKFMITVPPSLTDQGRIANILSCVDELIENEEKKRRSLDELFRTLLHDLMTGKVRVNDLEV